MKMYKLSKTQAEKLIMAINNINSAEIELQRANYIFNIVSSLVGESLKVDLKGKRIKVEKDELIVEE